MAKSHFPPIGKTRYSSGHNSPIRTISCSGSALKKRDRLVLVEFDEHGSLARQQPQFVDLRKFGHDVFDEIQRYAVVAALDLVEILAARQSDITSKIVGRHISPPNDRLKPFPIIQLFLHFFASIKFFSHLCIPGPVVQWIEYKIPVLTIWVRFPSGLLRAQALTTGACVFLSAPAAARCRRSDTRPPLPFSCRTPTPVRKEPPKTGPNCAIGLSAVGAHLSKSDKNNNNFRFHNSPKRNFPGFGYAKCVSREEPSLRRAAGGRESSYHSRIRPAGSPADWLRIIWLLR